jgi:competence protein ComEC
VRVGELRGRPHLHVAALCAGLAFANALRVPAAPAFTVGALVAVAAVLTEEPARTALLLLAVALFGWSWAGARLDAIDRSPLAAAIDTAERARVVVVAPPRHGRFEIRVEARISRFGRLRLSEPVELELPLGRAPPQGAVLDLVAVARRPRGPQNGFDERMWLRRHGIHVVLKVSTWHVVGRRGGLGGVADRLHRRLEGSIAPGVTGERRALVEGIVLGDDAALSDGLRTGFRVSGLYHLLAVSGQNVALVAGGALWLLWLLGVPRWAGHVGALAAIAGYVLAVGPQPSVLRAGVAGALGSLAWLAARPSDRWYFLLLAAAVLLAWSPYALLDPGFQLSFAAVVAIFVAAPWLMEMLEGYPIPRAVRGVVAISTACGVATAPILWLQFGAVPLLSVPANALADPAMLPLLGLAGASALLQPLAPGAAATAAWLNGWCAAYIAGCARLVASVPFAQARGPAAGLVAVGSVAAGAYAWRRWRRPI